MCVLSCRISISSFTTHGDKIWLTAIRTIGEGDRLSIDYGNNFYLPTAERRAELEDTYGVSLRGDTLGLSPLSCNAKVQRHFALKA